MRRIGEVLLIGPKGAGKADFIRALCEDVELNDRTMHLGRLSISDQLVLHFYGIHAGKNIPSFPWDLLAQKMLGCIVLFHWYSPESFEEAKYLIDFFTSRYQVPMVVAANVSGSDDFSVPERIYKGGIDITPEGKFTFCNTDDPASVRETVVNLIDIIMKRFS